MNENRARKKRRLHPPEAGPYLLKSVLEDIPLSAEEGEHSISITCVEFWNDNLYIGTSASEILHLVCLPPESDSDPPQYILATRLQPSGHDATASYTIGVKQILLLPGVFKAVVLCNGTASFYTLPELSPAFPNREPTGVQWIGGYDENLGLDSPDGTAIMIATSRNILQVRVGDKLRPIKPSIGYPECLEARRRETIACVADKKNYALLEIEHQQKIPLFSISTAPDSEEAQSNYPSPASTQSPAHTRSKSLGDFSASAVEREPSPGRDMLGPPRPADRPPSPAQHATQELRPGSRPRSSTGEPSSALPSSLNLPSKPLKPHVLSPSANEFMLTTGTTSVEPGVGMFVNLDGDVSRGTIEFDHYPEAVLAYSFPDSGDTGNEPNEAQLVIALIERKHQEQQIRALQMQTLPSDDDPTQQKVWLDLPNAGSNGLTGYAGLHRCLGTQRHVFPEVADLLQAVRFTPGTTAQPKQDLTASPKLSSGSLKQERGPIDLFSNDSSGPTPEYDQRRAAEELVFVQRLGHASTRALVWSNESLWHILPNPLLLQLESEILKTAGNGKQPFDYTAVNVSQVLSFLGSIRDREPKDETEFLSIKYARQKAGMVLYLHLLTGLAENGNLKASCRLAESALQESEIDPRIPLSLLQPLSRGVIQGSTGIWINQGIVDCLDAFTSPVSDFSVAPIEFWLMIRHFLSGWQDKRGFGSISDEKAVFDSVDTALLHLLLHLDTVLRKDEGAQAPTRAKLNNVVDHWKGNFDSAVTLLEHYKRLFILSRLYQSRKASKDVLHTWKRICEGEENADKDVTTEAIMGQMRKYLTVIRDSALVQEYAIWLAQRSPNLAVQVLSDDDSRVKFVPADVVTMLKAHAPASVQLFLEHLVFTKNLDQYADDLVGYYLDSVLNVLEHSDQARQSLVDSYTTYRALTPPKPTYVSFIEQNAPDEPWWQSRLRLLQLLGTGGYATESGSSKTLTYSIETVLGRLEPFSEYLVSESIILDARQGRHSEALKLLVHGLGDYDTAVRYCYFGGPSSPSSTIDAGMLPTRQQQQEQFQVLFNEFSRIEDIEERVERTSHLLGTFATWFDPLTVLNSIPETWPVAVLSDFLIRTFRAATTERNQSIIIKALSAAQNLQKQADFIDTCEKIGAKLEADGIGLQTPQPEIEITTD